MSQASNKDVAQTINQHFVAAFDETGSTSIARIDSLYAFAEALATHRFVLDDNSITLIVGKLEEFCSQYLATLQAPQLFRLIKASHSIYNTGRRKAFRALLPHFFNAFDRYIATPGVDEDAVACLYDWIFAIAWQQMLEMQPSSTEIKDRLIKPLNRYLSQNNAPTPTAKPNASGRLRIAYLAHNLSVTGPYANGRNIYSFIKGHAANNAPDVDIFVYVYSHLEESLLKTLVACPQITVRHFTANGFAEKQRQIQKATKNDGVDIVISEMYFSTSARLLSKQLAPIQMYMSMGFIPFELAQVDYYLMFNSIFEKARKYGLNNETVLEIPYCLDESFLTRRYPPQAIATERAKYPTSQFVFGALCRMEKVSEEYLQTIKAILDRVPSSILIIGGANDQSRIRTFLEANGLSQRVFLPGVVDPHLYGHFIDIFLETFPVGTGQAAAEIMAKGVPVIKLNCDKLLPAELPLRDPTLLNATTDDYIAKVIALTQDSAALTQAKTTAKQIVARVSDIKGGAQVIENYCRTAKERRLSGETP